MREKTYSPDGLNHRCATCKQFKPLGEFHIIKKTGKCRSYCRSCQSERASVYFVCNREKVLAGNAKYRRSEGQLDAQKARVRNWHYKKHYGISESQKRAMELEQGSKCAICKTPFCEMDIRRIHVDHCHSTGLVRGILCHNCNQVIGQAKDQIQILESAIQYLLASGVDWESVGNRDVFA